MGHCNTRSLSRCLCLFVISQIHNWVQHSKTGPFSRPGSRFISGSSPLTGCRFTAMLQPVDVSWLQSCQFCCHVQLYKKGQIKYELLCHNQQKFGVLETFRVSAVLYMWKFSHSWTMSDSYSSRKVSVCCRVIRNNSLKSKSEVMYLRAGSPTQFQWKRMNSVKLSD